jgi:hypothetical protein
LHFSLTARRDIDSVLSHLEVLFVRYEGVVDAVSSSCSSDDDFAVFSSLAFANDCEDVQMNDKK